ncbi:MAG: hypothetical protein ACOC38_08980 [Promethearchaeia archaeon]
MRKICIPGIWDFLLTVPLWYVYGGLLIGKGMGIFSAFMGIGVFSFSAMAVSKAVSSFPFIKIENVFYAFLVSLPCAFVGFMLFGALVAFFYGSGLLLPFDFCEIVLFLTLLLRTLLL